MTYIVPGLLELFTPEIQGNLAYTINQEWLKKIPFLKKVGQNPRAPDPKTTTLTLPYASPRAPNP